MAWKIPKMWEGGECWIIGGGPSVPRLFGVPEETVKAVHAREAAISEYSPYLSPIHGKHIIGANAAYLLGSWIDIMCWGDGRFYWDNQDELLKFRGVKVSFNPNTQPGRSGVYDSKYVPRDGNHPFGLTNKTGHVSWNKNTGAAAINLAYHLGAKRIILLGFDMMLDASTNQQHWHGQYQTAVEPQRPEQLPFKNHMGAFIHIGHDAKRLGLQILNANPESKIFQFPKVELEEVL